MTSLALVVSVFVAATPPSAAEQVKALTLKQAEAWNRGDLQAFTVVYAKDAVFLSPSGVTQGREQVLARYKKRYPDKKAMGTLSFEFLDARESAEMVTLAARWKLSYPDKPAASGLTLLVFKKRGDTWEMVQDASM